MELDRESLEPAAGFRLPLWVRTQRRGRRTRTVQLNAWRPSSRGAIQYCLAALSRWQEALGRD